MSIQLINVTSVLPSYLNPLLDIKVESSTISTVLIAIVLLIIFYALLILLANYLKLKRALKDKYVFIEVKPPYKALQSAFSTNQLFGVIHSLERQISFLDKLLKIKHTISCELVSTKEDGIRYILRIPCQLENNIVHGNSLILCIF